MVRILHVLGGLDRGGAETMVMNLYRAVDRTQVQFDFIIHTEKHQAYYDEIIALGGRIYSFPAFNGINVFALRKKWAEFFKNHPEYKILHSHVRSYASLYLPIAQKAGLKTIIHSHNTSSGKGLKAIVKFCLQRGLRKNVDYYFACSDVAGKWLFGEKITKQNNYFVLKNAIDVGKYAFSEECRKKIRDEFNIKDKFVVGHVGRFHPQKNHLFLVDVFAEIHKQCPNSILMLVGIGELMDAVKAKVAELKLNDSVIFTGSRDDVPALLSAMDVFVFPSLWEGLGIVAIEAQTSGMRTICSDVVPKDAQVTDLVEFISLSKSAEEWAESVLKCSCSYKRLNMQRFLVNAGYDVLTTVKWLQNFYLSI